MEKNNPALAYPVAFLVEIDMFEELFTKYHPNIRQEVTAQLQVKDLITEENEESFLKDYAETLVRYAKETAREVAEFGVDIDPNAPRYQWGTPEVNELAIQAMEAQYPINEGDVICYGPSNITYWYSLDQDMLPYHAQNHGMGGCIDDDLIHYAPRILYPYKPSAVIFQTGSNDIAGGIPLETILNNKRKMYAEFLKNMPQAKLIVCSGLPLPGRPQFWDATVKTNTLLKEMCEQTDRMYFLDATDDMLTDHGPECFKTSDGRYFNPGYYRIDKIHLNKKGHDVWTRLMKEKLDEIL
mgnify:CR=1 FL=1